MSGFPSTSSQEIPTLVAFHKTAMTIATLMLFINVASAMKDEPSSEFNPESLSGYFEGDIELMGDNPFHRNAISDKNNRWPNGVIPFMISSSFSSGTRDMIIDAIHTIENDTKVNGRKCIQFVPRSNQHDYLYYYTGSGCHSPVGRKGGRQYVTLGPGCLREGITMHETMHAMGFWHEQNRPDRDNYVTIHWNNIENGQSHNFQKQPNANTFGLPYDYGSIMHYSLNEFSKRGDLHTLDPEVPGVTVGQRIRLSTFDIKEIQLLYECISSSNTNNPTTHAPPVVSSEACTFETNLCGWTNSHDDRTDWVRWSGKTPSGRTGPNYDHRLDPNGHYIYVEATHQSHYTANIVSRKLPSGIYCFRLYYHMMGNAQGLLKISAIQLGNHKQTLRTISGDHGDLWKQTSIFYRATGTFQFELEGIIGSDYQSDIAVDDVIIHAGSCPQGSIVG